MEAERSFPKYDMFFFGNHFPAENYLKREYPSQRKYTETVSGQEIIAILALTFKWNGKISAYETIFRPEALHKDGPYLYPDIYYIVSPHAMDNGEGTLLGILLAGGPYRRRRGSYIASDLLAGIACPDKDARR